MTQQDGDSKKVAVALDYEMGHQDAPKVVASGRNEIAAQILKLAQENNIPIKQDSDLAEILSVVEIDCEIPIEAFSAVARILAYIYDANRGYVNK